MENNCVFGWEGKTIWFVVAASIKGSQSGKSDVDDSKLKPIQVLFADFMKNIVYPLQDAKC